MMAKLGVNEQTKMLEVGRYENSQNARSRTHSSSEQHMSTLSSLLPQQDCCKQGSDTIVCLCVCVYMSAHTHVCTRHVASLLPQRRRWHLGVHCQKVRLYHPRRGPQSTRSALCTCRSFQARRHDLVRNDWNVAYSLLSWKSCCTHSCHENERFLRPRMQSRLVRGCAERKYMRAMQ
jgi:hypothetical protein